MIRLSLTLITALCLSACVSGEGYENEDFSNSTQSVTSNGCQTICKQCAPNQVCTQVCELVGNCGSSCTVLALCIQGYHWDDNACRCLSDVGEQCGNRHCGAGSYCCNASCGICTPEGSGCIQIACAPAPRPGDCPNSDLVYCLVDPCEVSTCDVEGATCTANYCGGCNAEWSGPNGQPVCR